MFFSLQKNEWSQKKWKHLHFWNPMGIAGGVDKNAKYLASWWSLGAGFVEVGTVTPQPQKPNSGTIILRDNKSQSLWNKMGFPNQGLEAIKKRLEKINKPHFTPIFVNIGKNRDTPSQEAHKDYIKCIHSLHGLADAFVINTSSPNTKNLRDLFEPNYFRFFLESIISENKKLNQPTPLLLKLSPDSKSDELKKIIDTSCASGVDGFITSNTTTQRLHSTFPKEGGVSGASLKQKSIEQLKEVVSFLGPRKEQKLIVSCGGILTPKDISERLSLGADLIQVYSALIFDSPFFFKNSTHALKSKDI